MYTISIYCVCYTLLVYRYTSIDIYICNIHIYIYNVYIYIYTYQRAITIRYIYLVYQCTNSLTQTWLDNPFFFLRRLGFSSHICLPEVRRWIWISPLNIGIQWNSSKAGFHGFDQTN